MNSPRVTPEDIHRELERTLRLAPLDGDFDAAVLRRVDAAEHLAEAETAKLRERLARERKGMHFVVGLYGLAGIVLIAAVAQLASRFSLPAVDFAAINPFAANLPGLNALSLPIAAFAVLGAGAWMFARDRMSSILSI